MNTIKNTVSHVGLCREAVIRFSNEKSFKVHSSRIHLDMDEFNETPWPFAGLPVLYIVYSAQGKALHIGHSYNSTGMNNYFASDEHGRCRLRQKWENGTPAFIDFYCLSSTPIQLEDNGLLLELKRELNKVVAKADLQRPIFDSVKDLFRKVCIDDVLAHIDIDEKIMYAMETWYKAIASRPLQSMASTEDYYLRIVNPKLGENLPSIHLRQVICKYSDPSFCLVLDEGKMKDLGFLSRLPVYFDTPDESSYNDAVVGIIKSLSNIKNLMSHEDEKETH